MDVLPEFGGILGGDSDSDSDSQSLAGSEEVELRSVHSTRADFGPLVSLLSIWVCWLWILRHILAFGSFGNRCGGW